MGLVVFVSVCVTCYRPECPPHLGRGPWSWPHWWNLQGWRPIGQNGGHCPANRSRPHRVCTAVWSSLETSQLDRRKLRTRRVILTCQYTHSYENTNTRTHTLAVLTTVCSSGRRWKIWAGAWIERDGNPPSWPCAVTLCVLVVVVCLQNRHTDTYKDQYTIHICVFLATISWWVHHWGPDRNISATIWWISIKVCTDIHSPHRIKSNDFFIMPVIFF